MSKKCIKKDCDLYNVVLPDANEDYCEDCGSKLVKDTSNQSTNTGKFALDNHLDYQSGDRTIVEGDNIASQNVDNRNITTSNSNVVNNSVTNYQVSAATITCAISGRIVALSESVRCNGCGRYVALRYFDDDELACKDCRDKKKEPVTTVISPAREVRNSQEKAISPLASSSSITTTQARPIVEAIDPVGGKSSGSKKWILFVGVIAIAVVAYFFISPKGESDTTQLAVTQSTQSTENAVTPSVTKISDAVATEKPTSANAEKPKPKPTAELAIVKEVSALDQGKEAYNTGNFGKANLLFSKAAQSGESLGNYYLAKMHQEGKGVSKSIKRSYEYMLRAAEGGCEDAYYEVAEMLRTGNGTESNRSKAKKWYEKAAQSNKNSDKASTALSKYY